MNLHAHITVASPYNNHIPRGWKTTCIELFDASQRREQHNMLTRHFQIGKNGFNNIEDVIAFCKFVKGTFGEHALRLKIELDNLQELYLYRDNGEIPFRYLEAHIQTSEDHYTHEKGWEYSINVDSGDVFINYRYYVNNIPKFNQEVITMANKIYGNPTSEDAHIEMCVYDDNEGLDSWWL